MSLTLITIPSSRVLREMCSIDCAGRTHVERVLSPGIAPVGAELFGARVRLGLSREAAAERLGLHPFDLYGLENAHSTLSSEDLARALELLGASR